MLIGHFSILFGEVPIEVSTHFTIGSSIFLLLTSYCGNSLYMLDTSPLSDICITNFFTLFMVLNFNVKFISFIPLWLVIYKIFACLKNMALSSAFFSESLCVSLFTFRSTLSLEFFLGGEWDGGYGVKQKSVFIFSICISSTG